MMVIGFLLGFLFGLVVGIVPFVMLWISAEKSVIFWKERYFENDVWTTFSAQITPPYKTPQKPNVLIKEGQIKECKKC